MKQKTILVALIVVMLIASGFILYLSYQKPIQETNQITTSKNEKKEQINDASNLMEESKKKVANIKTKKATLRSVDIGEVVIVLTEGTKEEISLSVPEQGVTFVSQAKQEDGSFTNKEIGLFELPLDKEIEVQYDSANKELMMVAVDSN